MLERTPASPPDALLAGIDADYRHGAKHASPGSPLELPGLTLKWYDVHRADKPVPEGIGRMARQFLVSESRQGSLTPKGLGFVILHRCGEAFYFLIVCTWQNTNELWQTVYFKDGDRMPDFALFPRDEAHKPMLCVWELGPVGHERVAWTALLSSHRDGAAVSAYLDDRFSGAV